MNFILVLISAWLVSGMVWYVTDTWNLHHGQKEQIMTMTTREKGLRELAAVDQGVETESIYIAEAIYATGKTTIAIILLWLLL